MSTIFKEDDIVLSLVQTGTIDEVLSGDTWIELNTDIKEFHKYGILVQIESKELDDGVFSDDTFVFYGYANRLSENGETITSNYQDTLFKFERHEQEIRSISKEVA